MNSPAISTVAFAGALVMLGLFVFQVVPVKTALLLGGGLVVVGAITQPPSGSA